MIRIGVAIERHAGGGQTVRAISCLPALVGAWRQVGGGLLQLPLWAFPVNWGALMHPELARPGTRVVNQFLLGRALTGELALDPPITALFVYNSNPVVVCPEQEKVVAGLARDDLFTVVSDHFLTDTARYADIVLPATTQLEQHDIMFSWGHFYVTLNTPAVEPRRRGGVQHRAVPPARRPDGLHRGVFHPHRRGDGGRGVRLVGPGDGRHHRRVSCRDGWARLNLPPPTSTPRTPRATSRPVGQDRVPVVDRRAGGNFVVPLFRQGSTSTSPATRSTPCRTTSRRGRRPTPATGST